MGSVCGTDNKPKPNNVASSINDLSNKETKGKIDNNDKEVNKSINNRNDNLKDIEQTGKEKNENKEIIQSKKE